MCSVGLFTLRLQIFVGLYTLRTFFSPGKLLIRGSFCGLKCYLMAQVCMHIVRMLLINFVSNKTSRCENIREKIEFQ